MSVTGMMSLCALRSAGRVMNRERAMPKASLAIAVAPAQSELGEDASASELIRVALKRAAG